MTKEKNISLENLITQMDSLQRTFHAQRASLSLGANPTPAQMGVLCVVYREQVGVRELAQRFGLTASAITQLVNHLVDNGYIRRVEDKTDRRKIILSLTPKGKKQVVVLRKKKVEMIRKIFENLDQKEVEQLSKILEKVIPHIETLWKKNLKK